MLSDLCSWSRGACIALCFCLAVSTVGATQQLTNDPQWATFKSQDSKDCQFSVVFPIKPTIAKDSLKRSQTDGFPIWTYSATGKRAAYILSCTISPPIFSSRGRESAMLAGERDETLRAAAGKLSDDKAITVSGFPGRAFTIIFTASNTRYISYYELVLTERTLYQLAVTIPTDYIKPDKVTDVDRFFDSFSISPH